MLRSLLICVQIAASRMPIVKQQSGGVSDGASASIT